MKVIKRLIKFTAAAVIVGGLVTLNSNVGLHNNPKDLKKASANAVTQQNQSSSGINIVLTAGIDSNTMNILKKTAGISAYAKLNSINLNTAKSIFYTVESKTSDYIIGTIAVDGYGTNRYPHLFIHKNGWIVTYYSNTDSASTMLDLKSYSAGNVSTTLQESISQVLESLKATQNTAVKYYDFAYPSATKLMAIVDKDYFDINIPTQLTVYETSGYMGGTSADYDWNYFSIDKQLLTKGINHKINYYDSYGSGYYELDEKELKLLINHDTSEAALVVVYK